MSIKVISSTLPNYRGSNSFIEHHFISVQPTFAHSHTTLQTIHNDNSRTQLPHFPQLGLRLEHQTENPEDNPRRPRGPRGVHKARLRKRNPQLGRGVRQEPPGVQQGTDLYGDAGRVQQEVGTAPIVVLQEGDAERRGAGQDDGARCYQIAQEQADEGGWGRRELVGGF